MPSRVIKGGSYLCFVQLLRARYRPTARQRRRRTECGPSQFRTVLNAGRITAHLPLDEESDPSGGGVIIDAKVKLGWVHRPIACGKHLG
jgi:hypothetical protein